MKTRGSLATLLVALVLLGCKGVQPTSAAASGVGAKGTSSGDGSGAASSPGIGAGGSRVEYITDPTLNNMKVMPIQIPASWSFRGMFIPMGNCTDASEVFRATSPDGHSLVEVMPRVGWKWGNLYADPNSRQGCLDIDEPISALEFVKRMTAIMQVEYLEEKPVPGYTGPVPIPGGKWTTAMAAIRYKNGSLNMKGLVQAGLFCREAGASGQPAAANQGRGFAPQQNARPGVSGGHCDAVVTYSAAPENQFDQVMKIWSAPGMGRHKEIDDWVAVYSQRYANQLQARTTKWLNESDQAFAARQQMYKDEAAVQQQTHEQFMETSREGTEKSMAHAAEVANSNHRMASDMVDYSLDRQTVLFPNSSAAMKLPNTVTVEGAVRAHGDGTPWY